MNQLTNMDSGSLAVSSSLAAEAESSAVAARVSFSGRHSSGGARPTIETALTGRQVGTICAVFLGMAVGYACAYGATSTTFILPLTKEFGWGRTVPSLMFVFAMLGAALASAFLGRFIDRFGAPRVAVLSGLCLALVMMSLSVMSGSPTIAVLLGFLAGLSGAGTGTGLYVSVLPGWFDRQLGRALGIAVVGQSVGSMLMPPISVAVISGYGWRAAYMTLALLQLALTLCAALILARIGRPPAPAPAVAAAKAANGDISPSEAMRTRRFWLLQAMIFFQSLGMFGMSVHIFPIYSDRGVAWSMLPSITIVLSVGMMVGRVVSGFLLDRFDARAVTAGMFAIGAAGIAWLASASGSPTLALIYVPPFAIGLAFGAETDILAYLARRLYGLTHFATIFNRLLIGFFVGSMAGPPIVGWAFDRFGQSHSILWALSASCMLAAIIALSLPRPSLSVGERQA
ncbi:MFS transporter [Bradyrhizobium sp. WSM3983]|uniref:MFS transporter n=1 Tax=Bradyrhizobium sp. WSM3983 TaxID=1038867 RepID=UPI0003F9615A|nr:MFS transporter [Bradyrhizobium sp. WSM3983]